MIRKCLYEHQRIQITDYSKNIDFCMNHGMKTMLKYTALLNFCNF